MSLAAGSLNRLITVQRHLEGQHEDGQPFDEWQDVLPPIWANVKGQTGLGAIKAATDVPLSVTSYSFRIRYRIGIDAGMRILFGNVPYDITSVQMDEAGREWTDLVCNRGANNG